MRGERIGRLRPGEAVAADAAALRAACAIRQEMKENELSDVTVGRKLGTASASAPFVATLVDVSGLVIYFSIALVILRGTLL